MEGISEFDRLVKLCEGDWAPKIKELPVSKQLELYAYGKQGADGDAVGAAPSRFNLVASYKWKAHEKLKGMDRDQAKRKFVTLALEVAPRSAKL